MHSFTKIMVICFGLLGVSGLKPASEQNGGDGRAEGVIGVGRSAQVTGFRRMVVPRKLEKGRPINFLLTGRVRNFLVVRVARIQSHFGAT